MITCEFCGTQAEQHDHWRHLLVARVAALEDVVTGEAAEQPSRQETGGDCGVPGCHACTAMRDRAKAKAADRVVEHMRPLMVTEAGRALMTTPAEPSGTGQVASTPVCECGHSLAYHVNGFHEARDCGFELDGDFCACSRYREHAAPNATPIAEPPAPAVGTLSEAVTCSGCSGLNGRHEVFCTTLAADLLRSLNKPSIHGVYRACAPIVRKVAALEANLADVERRRLGAEQAASTANEALRSYKAKLAQAERERDERGRQVEQMAEHVAKMRVERDEWKELAHKEKRNATDATRDLENALVQSEVRVDEATARERERCLAWAQADVDNGEIATAIDNGAPAPKCDPDPPREVAPDRTQAGSVDKNARIYPCKECGDMRSMAEGGTTFTVCDACWDKTYPTARKRGEP